MPDQPALSTGIEWRRAREEGVPVEFPSGLVARLRPVPLDLLLRSGAIPDRLSALAAATLWTVKEPEELASDKELGEQALDLLDLVAKASFVSPRIVDVPAPGQVLRDDEITLEDLSLAEKQIVFGLATAGADALRGFRPKQTGSVAAVPDGQDAGPEASGPSGDRGTLDAAATG